MILNDIVKSLTGGSDERVNASWRASLTTAWLIVNWQFIAYITMSDEPISERITSAINIYYSNWNWIYLPLIVWFGYMLATPIISLANIAYHQLFKGIELQFKQTSSQKEIDRLDTETRRLEDITTKLEIDRNDLQKKYDQIVVQSNDINDEITKLQNDKEVLQNTIIELEGNKKDFETQIESQKATMDELANEYNARKIQLEEELSELDKQIESKRNEDKSENNTPKMSREVIISNKNNLRGANLTNIKNWGNITYIKYANITNIRYAPDGFREWALKNGAVEDPSKEESEKKKMLDLFPEE